MKFALIFPPEYDGELHLNVEQLDKNHLKIELVIAQEGEETVVQTLRRLGRHLMLQPIQSRASN